MQRLTKRTHNGKRVYLIDDASVCWANVSIVDRGFCAKCTNRPQRRDDCGPLRLIDKLAAYEDTGLEPEEITELARAKAECRLVVLPCKIGDKVYCITAANKRIVEDTVEDFDIWTIKDGKLHLRIRLANWRDYVMGILGETIFLTREEVEKALEGAQHG